jgi:dihydroorotate dehydrogenase (fumarate)
MTDLSTTYLGLNLKNPLVAAASPLSKKMDRARKLEEMGISAIVMYSLFEEQIIRESLELDHYLSRGADSSPEASSYLPDGGLYGVSPEKYLNQVAGLKKALKIPVIGSLNGFSKGGWTNYARRIQEAGADALELNMYYLAADPDVSSSDIENMQVDLVAEIKSAITIPLAVRSAHSYVRSKLRGDLSRRVQTGLFCSIASINLTLTWRNLRWCTAWT